MNNFLHLHRWYSILITRPSERDGSIDYSLSVAADVDHLSRPSFQAYPECLNASKCSVFVVFL